MKDGLTSQPRLEIVEIAAKSEEALQLISELTIELSGQYEHAEDGTGDFRPEDSLPAKRLSGRPFRRRARRLWSAATT